MAGEAAPLMDRLIKAHEETRGEDIARLRRLSMEERSELIESACKAAAVFYRSRLAAGLPDVEPAPWPASTWEFLKRHAARVRS
ncbi:MAG: hypothetical protein GXX96_35000 [Planctomycetaceae bacterium]|nr:hypothetical protein [Planctomycetaceae bacterium]